MSEHNFTPRTTRRLPVEVPAIAKDAKGGSWRGVLYDLSAEGCQFRFKRGVCPDEGALIGVQFAGLEAQAAEIVWTSQEALGEGRVGLLFSRPLYPAVMEDIARRMKRAEALDGREVLEDLPDMSGRYQRS